MKPNINEIVPNAEELRECTDFLTKNPHSVKKWITLADKYMQTLCKDPETFLIAKPHSFLEPLVRAYATNLEDFLLYLIELRDAFSKEDLAWEHVQTVYRRINGRFVQQQRRERSNRAIAKAEEQYGPTDFHSRLQWVADLEHSWAGRRLLFLDDYRDKYKTKRLDTETRAEVLLEFWETIDFEIHTGKDLPPWN